MKYIDFTECMNKKHKKVKRDYLKRMTKDKPEAIEAAKKYDYDFWDGDRKFGYGGYYYDGRWKPVAEKLRLYYKLKPGMRVLDIGCGKGYLLYELKQLCPELEVYGIDISEYAVRWAKNEVKQNISVCDATDIPWKNNYFDLVLSLGTLHNLPIYDLEKAIYEINRVGRNSYITMESYRNEQEKFNLMCWVLTGECFFSDKEWEWILNKFYYDGEYSLFHFE